MSHRWARYAYAGSGGQKIYFSPRWSRPVAPRRTEWILPAYARAIFLKKTFIIGLSLSLAFAPLTSSVVIADDTVTTDKLATEATESESEEISEPEEEPAEELPAEESTENAPVTEEEPVTESASLAAPTATEEEPAPAEDSPCEEGESSEESGDGSLVESCNEAEVKTDTAASSDTGDNAVIHEEPEAVIEEPAGETETPIEEPTAVEPWSVIDTGDAGAAAAAVNDVNTVVVGTDVDWEVVTKDGSDDEDVDLLESFVAGDAEPVDVEAAIDGGSGGLVIENGNEATIDNTVVATAKTGDNAIEGGGNAAIGTGDASAVAVAINVVNTTLVGSNGLLAIVNIVGDYAGDVIVPGEGLLSYGDGNTGNLETVENDNEATIDDTVTASADTGDNAIEASETASIETGDAEASAASSTIANTNFVGDNWLVVVVNVFGEWLGGIVDGEDADLDGVMGFFFGSDGDGGNCEAGCGDVVSVTGKNVAYVVNTVTATADTGGNTIEGAGDAAIVTGDAGATAAAFNFVNNNIIGSNWFLGIVNVFGSWSGDLVFAYPDLATSVTDGRDTALPGETLDYRVTVENRGHADAEDVSVAFRLPDRAAYRSASDGGNHDGDTVTWVLSGMEKGESKAFSVSVTIEGSTPDGTDLRAYAQAATGTAEKHPEDNASDDSTRIDIPARVTGFDADDDPDHTGLRVRRSKPDRSYRGGEAITHWITVENTGKHDAHDVVVRDTFRNPGETVIAEPQWFLGEIESGEGLRIEYTIVIPTSVGAGEYRYTTRAEGREGDDEAIASKRAYALLSIAGSAFAGTLGAEMALAEELPVPGEVRGAEATTIGEFVAREEFPLWMLLLSGLAYFLMINWSFFPSGNRRNTYL